ncbi:MAG: efflux RND transporter permease subunit [Bacteroidaceae bacterium]|nr:efflux RND transporter permease subunit [Bacteroidaceae bacterium]
MKLSRFTLLLTLAILMVIGCALIPRIDVADKPRPTQGKTLDVSFSWDGASAKVIEQNVTSRIEGLVAAVRGVENVKSESYFGSGHVTIELKKNTNVSATKFEIASLLRQVRKQLPQGVSYPELSGGEVVNENQRKETTQVLLSYCVNSNLSDEQLKEYIERQVEPVLRQIDEVKRVEVTGGKSKYIVITYDPFILSSYGLSASDIENGIKSFLGKSDVVGEVQPKGQKEKRTLYLSTDKFGKPLEEMPIGMVDGKTVYLGDLATYEYKDRLPDYYYRINGLNTIYLNIHVDADANKIALSGKLRKKISEVGKNLRQGVYLTQIYDGAEENETELHKLIWRSALSLLILLVFVWLVRWDWRYLFIMMLTLASNLALAVIAYYVFDIRLHIYSLAGITVSLGMVIDAAVVMVDHYSYYHNRKAFMAILAALLTTIGSLIVVLWLPDFLQKDLYDFAWIIIINLSVALIVSWLFVPALIDQLGYNSRQQGKVRHLRFASRWNNLYLKYICFTQKRKWIYYILIVLAFGIPFHALPTKWGESDDFYAYMHDDSSVMPWYERAYNATIGSSFFQNKCKEPLSKYLGGTMRLFSQSMSGNTYSSNEKKEIKLNIRAQMPLGGTAAQLNEKVVMLENFLVTFPEIERIETRVGNWGADITVEFKEEYKKSAFPYMLENKVIGKVISIGGADWATSGVSERGFSNSLNLQYRSNKIELVGYNYDQLYRIAEDMCDEMRKNDRVLDLMIETPEHENQEDELYMRYDKEKIALYNFDLSAAHGTLGELLSGREIDRYRDTHFSSDMYLKSSWQDKFDLWRLDNSFLKVGDKEDRVSDFMSIERRQAKNCIPRQNQEYVLHVAFNILGSYTYASRFIERTIKECNQRIPVGYKCQNVSYGYYKDDGTQYWLLGLIIIIIFFVCSILFESLRLPLAIISLIPVSFIGTFLTYWLSGVEFGTGGFASMVLLSGLTVNAGIYIICEYRNQLAAHTAVSPIKTYVRAYSHKIIAVFLTILSTVLGLVPFFIDGAKESFWFSFAVGSTGGLLFSIVALVAVMPIFLRLSAFRKERN